MKASRHSRALSSASFGSFSSSNTATTNASTIWGPGTLSGRAIEAFGEATLRGIENIVIRRKLASYRSLFPHTDDTTIKNISSVYQNVLELSRPMLYSKSTNQAALRLIIMQIATRETHHLRKGLQKWPMVELKLFLSQIMNTSMHSWSQDVSGRDNAATSRNGNSLIPILDLFALIADHDDSACQAALDAGLLDMLLRIYVVFPKLRRGMSGLVSACESALLVLSRHPEHLEVITHHPVCSLWATCGQLFQMSAIAADDSLSGRCSAWRRTHKSCVMSRLVTIHKFLLPTSRLKEAMTTDMCTDLVEFSRPESYDPAVIELATLVMFKCISIGGDGTRHLVTALAGASYQDIVGIFSRVIQLWLEYVQTRDTPDMTPQIEAGMHWRHSTPTGPIAVTKSSYIQEKGLLFRKIETIQRRILPLNDRPLHNIINFAIAAAKHSMTIRWGILDAGILALVPLAFVDGVVPLLSELLGSLGRQSSSDSTLPLQHKHSSGAETEPHELDVTVISLAVINTQASMLIHHIQAPQFQELLCSEMFGTRRSICLLLLDTFLGSERGVDDAYSEFRSLCAQILAERDSSLIPVRSVNTGAPVESSMWQSFPTSASDVGSLHEIAVIYGPL